jgi:hypothetical protein
MKGWFDKMDSTVMKSFANAPIGSQTPTIGGDPEFFIVSQKKSVINADKYLPGKHNPIVLPHANRDLLSKIYFDGIQAEIAVAYDTCRDALVSTMADCIRRVADEIPNTTTLEMAPSILVPKKIIERADPEARIFGCMPDFNAYTLSVNTPEMDASAHKYRYAGGHLHLGISDPKTKNRYQLAMAKTEEGHIGLIKWLDLMISIPTFFLDNDESAKIRKLKYGKAGCFRPTPYGVEYRTPSCWWLKSPATMSLIYGFAKLAWEMAIYQIGGKSGPTFKNYILKQTKISLDNEVRGSLDESDEKTIQKLWHTLRPYVILFGMGSRNPVSATYTDEYMGDRVCNKTSAAAQESHVVWDFAAFEYILANGLSTLIPANPLTAWSARGRKSAYKSYAGMGFSKLSQAKFIGNTDFHKFQKSLLKEAFPYFTSFY